MLRTLLMLGVLTSAALPCSAINPLLRSVQLTPELVHQLRTAPGGGLYLEIDDMWIPVSQSKSVSQGTLWTGGVVYYQFHSNVENADGRPMSGDGTARRAAWRAAAMEWEATVPGLRFVEGTGNGSYILVQSADGNSSYVGMVHQIYQPQTMNIYNWNWRFIIAHEIGHALGLLHEQSRADRDSYVLVNYQYIQDNREYNYDKDLGSTAHGPYDYHSSMHYGRCSFWDTSQGSCGANGYTMDATAAGAASVGLSEAEANGAMGQRDDLSTGDILGVRSLYTTPPIIFESCFENGRSNAWSSAAGVAVPCAHDPCQVGATLDSECDPCVAQINAGDPFCRDSYWDSFCVSQVSSVCGESCD